MSSTPSSVPSAPPEAPQPKFGAFARLTGVFFSPGETFADVARVPGWIAPVILMTVLSLAVNIILARRVDWDQVSRRNMEKIPIVAQQFEKLSDDQKAEAYAREARNARIGRYFRGALGSLALVLLTGAIYLGAFKLAGAGALNFKIACAIIAYSYLPLAVHDLIGIPILLLKDASTIDPEIFVASNIAALLPGDAPLWHIALGGSVDIFAFWILVLRAIGFSAFNPKKIPLGKSFGVVIGIYLFFVAFFTGIAFIFS